MPMSREEYERRYAELDAEVERTHQAMITGMKARLPESELDPLKRAACDAEEAYVRFMSLPEHAEHNAENEVPPAPTGAAESMTRLLEHEYRREGGEV